MARARTIGGSLVTVALILAVVALSRAVQSRTPSSTAVTGGISSAAATMPTGRFASGVSGGVRFVGVCIPWRDAHVTSGRKDRARWEDHILYCEGLGRVLQRCAKSNVPICVLGDYNQRIPRFKQPPRVAEALSAAFPPGFRIGTDGMTDADGYGLIDHFAVSPGQCISITKIISRITEDGTRLTDHVGIAASLDSRVCF